MNKIYIVLMLLIPSTAFAYFDIGTGTYLFQIVLASFFGAMYTARSYISAMFRKVFRKQDLSKESLKKEDPAS